MKKCFKKAVSSILATAMIISSSAITYVNVAAAPSFSLIGGWNETIYAEISGVKDADVTAVSYTGTMSGSLSGDDLEYLVRDTSNGVRIDVLGLKPGDYTFTVKTSSGDVTQSVNVPEQDRSGFAHYTTDGGAKSYAAGAYNLDGTLKNNAKVLYVTDENKDTISVTSSDGTTVTGIGNILNSAGKDNGTGVNSKGGIPNSNAGIIGKLADDGTPLVVRIVGNVTAPVGVTAYDSADYGGTVGDNGYMARMQGGKDVTIEGIGSDATINGWGIHFIADTAGSLKGNGKSFEVRNISFKNVPEDCVGMEGQQEGSTITAPVEHCWIHNCSFYAPSISNPAESDKAGGDGACDFKRGMYFTNSYCYYEGYHKTNLVGSSDSSLQFHLTYHHNYWKNCQARGPLARQADIHMYNNIFDGQTDYAMNTRANAYIFSESNLFFMCKNAMRVDAGAIKSYNDSFTACIEDLAGTVVTDKNQTVATSCTYANFDTDSSVSYIPSGDYDLQEDIVEAKKVVMAYAGVQAANPVTPDEVSTSILTSGNEPTASVTLPYSQNLNSTYLAKGTQTKDNIIFTTAKVATTDITIGSSTAGQDIVFNINTPCNITMTDGGASYPVILMNDSGVEYLTGSGTAYNVPAGTYIIQSSGFQPAKSGSPAKYKEAKITYLGIEAYDPTAPTVTEPTTQGTTEKGSEATTAPASEGTTSTGEEDPTEETTDAPYTGEGLVWDYTNKTNTLNANVDANDWSSATAVTYNGSSFTSAVKMESDSSITFTAPGSGKLTLVTYSTKNPATVVLNGETKNVSQSGSATFDVSAGTVTLTKGTASTYLYVMEFVGEGGSEASTEATTVAPTTEAPTEATTVAPTTEAPTEAPTTAPVEGVNVSIGSTSGKVGESVVVPIKLTGMSNLATYTVSVAYDSTKLTATGVTNGDILNSANAKLTYNTATSGVVNITAINPDDTINTNGTALANIVFTGVQSGTANITLTVKELLSAGNGAVTYATSNGTVTLTETPTTDGSGNGDVNKDGKVDTVDAAIVLKIAAGIITDTTAYDIYAADCDGKAGINELDAVWILNHTGTISANKTYTLTGSDIAAAGSSLTANANIGTENMFLALTGVKNASGAIQISGTKTVQFKLTNAGTITLADCVSSNATYGRQVVIKNEAGDIVATLDVENSTGTKASLNSQALAAGTYTISGVKTDTADTGTSVNIGSITVVGILEQLSVPTETTTVTTTTETTTETTTATTTTTTEATTEATTSAPVSSDYVSAGTYNLNEGTIGNELTGSYSGINYNLASVEADHVRVKNTNSISFKVKEAMNLTITFTSNNITINGDVIDKANSPYTMQLNADVEYVIAGETGSNSRISSLVFAAASEVTTAGPTTQATTVTTTETTTETTTVTTTTKATTTTTEATTEATTSAPVSGSVYNHNFGTDGKDSTFYTITGSLSTSKGDVTYNGLTISQCLKMESSTNISFTASNSGTLTLVFGGTTSAVGMKVKIDGTEYTANSNGIVTASLASGTHTVTKVDGINLFYMSFAEGGAVVGPTEATTNNSEATTEATTNNTSDTPSSGVITLTTPPSTKVATITSDSQADFETALSTVNKSGGTIYIDTPVLSISGSSTSLKLSGTTAGAIVGVQQSDGTYPVIDFSAARDAGSTKRGITISGQNQLIQNVIVESAGDNGILIDGGSNNKIEHVIARYNGDTGIQLSNDATDNTIKYCYSYRNCDVATYGANADGFAPKLGAKGTKFEYCYSWDNSDDGWDSYDKTDDNTPWVEYLHCACWNNGKTEVFTGEYDYNNGNALDTKLLSIQQIMAADANFASNYANGNFDTSSGKIAGKTVSSWVSSAESAMNGNGFKFGSSETATDGSVTRTARYCVAFDHKSKGFDNNNSTNCKGYFTNCVSFGNNNNYKLPYDIQEWTNVFGWDAKSNNTTSDTPKTATVPSDTTLATNTIYAVRDKIVEAVYANKMPDDINFDSAIDSLR